MHEYKNDGKLKKCKDRINRDGMQTLVSFDPLL